MPMHYGRLGVPLRLCEADDSSTWQAGATARSDEEDIVFETAPGLINETIRTQCFLIAA